MLGSTRSSFLIIVIFDIAVISGVRCVYLLILIKNDLLFLIILLLLLFFIAALQTVTNLLRGRLFVRRHRHDATIADLHPAVSSLAIPTLDRFISTPSSVVYFQVYNHAFEFVYGAGYRGLFSQV